MVCSGLLLRQIQLDSESRRIFDLQMLIGRVGGVAGWGYSGRLKLQPMIVMAAWPQLYVPCSLLNPNHVVGSGVGRSSLASNICSS